MTPVSLSLATGQRGDVPLNLDNNNACAKLGLGYYGTYWYVVYVVRGGIHHHCLAFASSTLSSSVHSGTTYPL